MTVLDTIRSHDDAYETYDRRRPSIRMGKALLPRHYIQNADIATDVTNYATLLLFMDHDTKTEITRQRLRISLNSDNESCLEEFCRHYEIITKSFHPNLEELASSPNWVKQAISSERTSKSMSDQ